MKIKECIKLAAEALNLQTDESGEVEKTLLRCANNCLDEITSEYIPLKAEKTVTSTDKSVSYSLLGDTVYDVLKITDSSGREVEFSLMPSRIKVARDGTFNVQFLTRSPTLGIDDDVPVCLRVTPRIISYGIIAEYLLVNGFYSEAITYDTRFKDALKRSQSGLGEKRVKGRRWLI